MKKNKISRNKFNQPNKKNPNVIKKQAEDLNRHFCKQNTMLANRHMKRSSMSLIIRYMQIKTTKIFYFTPVRMAVIKSQKIRFGKDVRKGNPWTPLVKT